MPILQSKFAIRSCNEQWTHNEPKESVHFRSPRTRIDANIDGATLCPPLEEPTLQHGKQPWHLIPKRKNNTSSLTLHVYCNITPCFTFLISNRSKIRPPPGRRRPGPVSSRPVIAACPLQAGGQPLCRSATAAGQTRPTNGYRSVTSPQPVT